MIRLNTSASFLGLDLSELRRDWVFAVHQIANWPVLRWLAPAYATHIEADGGGTGNYVEKADRTISVSRHTGPVKFHGFLLPDTLLLWHPMVLPKLGADSAQAAMALQIRSLSPFQPDDEVWAHTPLMATQEGSQTQLVIASRKIIAKYLLSIESKSTSQRTFELWVKVPDAGGFLVLEGFGEQVRRRLVARWRWANLGLVFLLGAIGFAAAVSPTAQLRSRAIQAEQDFIKLQTLAAPAVRQRERLVQLDEQVKALQAQMLPQVRPELVLLAITKLLGDDTFISAMQVQGTKVSLTGQTPNTAALMQQLGGQAGIKNVKSPVAVFKQLGVNRETFSIEFTLDPSSLPAKP